MTTVSSDIQEALAETRARTLGLIAGLDPPTLETVHSTLLSPLVWDLGHIAAFEDLWIARSFDVPMLAPELIHVYDADETPRAQRGDLPFLRTEAAHAHLEEVRAHTLRTLEDHVDDPRPERLELIMRHELQHNETMLQAMQIAGLEPGVTYQLPRPGAGRFITVDAHTATIGADPADGFAYDNERGRHDRRLPPFEIATTPVTNGEWLEFVSAGGYGDRALWSDAGWAWREAEDATGPLYWDRDGGSGHRQFAADTERHPDEPVVHVCHHEADAYARFRGVRLPTEFELEAARPQLQGAGAVWEWTQSAFSAYPEFRADPYPEYSEQFFGDHYRVLRGGSFVSSPRVATPTFRNWDLPQRRQIFSGVRLARDPA